MKTRNVLWVLAALACLMISLAGNPVLAAEAAGEGPAIALPLPADAAEPTATTGTALTDLLNPTMSGAAMLGGAFVVGAAATGSLVTGIATAAAAALAYSFMP